MPVTTVPSRRHRTEWIALVLRQSSLGLMNATNNAHYAHPAFWARFVVVGGGGEGGRGRKRAEEGEGHWRHPKVPPVHRVTLKFTAGFDSSRPHGCHYCEYVGERTRFGVAR